MVKPSPEQQPLFIIPHSSSSLANFEKDWLTFFSLQHSSSFFYNAWKRPQGTLLTLAAAACHKSDHCVLHIWTPHRIAKWWIGLLWRGCPSFAKVRTNCFLSFLSTWAWQQDTENGWAFSDICWGAIKIILTLSFLGKKKKKITDFSHQ